MSWLLFCAWPIFLVFAAGLLSLGVSSSIITVNAVVKAVAYKDKSSSVFSIIVASFFSGLTLYTGIIAIRAVLKFAMIIS